jgi:quinol-cytochrome oxidoreductase complex cytochrome b subunit
VIGTLKDVVNALTAPEIFITVCAIAFLIALRTRGIWRSRPAAIMGILDVAFLGVSMLDPNFALIVKKPDNVPIVAMLFLVGFFLWLSMSQAYDNDDRIAAGQPPREASDGEAEKTWVWPDLVYTELLAMVIGMIVLVVWSLLLKAPIEEPANPARTPNPSKAPWYFLGLQELLTIWHPMVAGVTIPGMGLIVLMMAPYIDKNPATKPNDRKFAICLFTLFLMFWAVLVIIGSFFRGPGFNFVYPWKVGTFFDL